MVMHLPLAAVVPPVASAVVPRAAGDALVVDPASAALPSTMTGLPSGVGAFVEGVRTPPPMTPMVILALCVAAGLGTYLLLPKRRARGVRQLGGAVLLLASAAFVAFVARWSLGSAGGMNNPYFWLFSGLALVSSLRVVTHPRPVYSALYFVLTVFSTAGLFVLLWAEFMAAALVLIYAGAILVAYVFVIMLAAEASPSLSPTDQEGLAAVTAEHDAVSREPLAAAVVGFALMGILLFVIFDRFGEPGGLRLVGPPPVSAELAGQLPPYPLVEGSTQELGDYLFNRQPAGLQLAAVILTLSVIGAIVISRRQVLVPTSTADRRAVLTEVKAGPVPSGIDDDPKHIPIFGTADASHKAYPEA